MSNIIYVNVNASGNNDGSSWENAYNNLQDALNSAVAEDRVWVADGTYLPSTTNNRDTSFAIPSNVKVYGGFTGGETELNQRNPQQNITTLSGDLGISGDNADNSFNVVTLNEVESETLLDGFTIAQGNADGDGDISNLANNAGGGIYAENSSATLNNLIVTDNNASRGGGMFSDRSNHQITNVRFVGNSAGALLGGVGGGLSTANGTETLENVAFVNNTANAGNGGAIDNNRSNLELNDLEFIANQAGNYGGAIHNSFDDRTSFNLTNSVFLHNTASGNNTIGNIRISSGGAIYSTESDRSTDNSISNSIFQGSSADFGGAIFNDDVEFQITDSLFTDNFSIAGAGVYNLGTNFTGINNTFANNLSQFASGVGSEGSARGNETTTLTNSIFWANQTTYEPNSITNKDATTEVSSSLVEGGYDGSQIITEDPQFVNPNSFDYRLSEDSPALNRGNNEVVASENTDLAGNDRILEETVDLGAYEGAAIGPVPVSPQLSETTTIVYVDVDAGGENNGTSWENAYSNLRAALNNAPFGSQIWVAEGTYKPSSENRALSFQLQNGVAVYGGFNGSETSLSERNISENQTILSGEIGDTATTEDNTFHVVNASNVTNSTILDGFTIRNGNATGESTSSFTGDIGGGIFSSSSHAIFNNLRLENNRAENGAAIYVDGSSSHIFTNVDFVNNTSSERGGAVFSERGNLFFFESNFRNNKSSTGGGAIFSTESSLYIEGTTFDRNQTEESGGAIVINNGTAGDNAPQKIVNSIFTNNTAIQGGAIANAAGSFEGVNLTFTGNEAERGAAVFNAAVALGELTIPEYYNSIFWDNTGTVETEQIFNEFEPATVRNSIVQGGYTEGEEIVDSDPQFVSQDTGNLRIRSDSPGVNAGLNTVVTEDDDVADRPRINQETVDIGAYEFTDGDNESGSGDTGGNNPDPDVQTIDLFRFRNTSFESGTYVFVGEQEKNDILADENLSNTFSLDGQQDDGTVNPAFTASETPGDDLISFYRLKSLDVLGTFLFVAQQEYDGIFAGDSEQRDKWEKEGLDADGEDIPEFYLYDGSSDIGTEFNRFQNTQNGTFLYAGEGETSAIEGDPNLSNLFSNQGVAFKSL